MLTVTVAFAASFCDGLTGCCIGIVGAFAGVILLQFGGLWTIGRSGWNIMLCAVLVLLGWLVGVTSESARKGLRSVGRRLADPLKPAYRSLGLVTSEEFGQRLVEEARRATYFSRPLSLLILQSRPVMGSSGARPSTESASDGYRLAERGLARIIEEGARETDVPGNLGRGTIALLLPETDLPGAWRATAQALQAIGSGSVAVGDEFVEFASLLDIRFGLAELDDDDPTGGKLSENAQSAFVLLDSSDEPA